MSSRYSFSRINQFANCPRQYKFAYIEKAVVEKPVSVEMFMGSAVHRSLEKLYWFKNEGKLWPLDDFIAFYKEIWEGPDKEKIKVTAENMAVEDYIAKGEKALRDYYEKYQPFDEGEIIGLEKMISFPLDPRGRYSISGKIDKIIKRPDGVVEIVDYKTSRSLITQPALDDDMQMGLYQAGVNTLWPQFDRIELKQIFLVKDIEMKTVMPTEKIDEIRHRTFEAILDIERAVKEDNFPPHESGLCDYCLYFSLCPAKRHGLALKGEGEEAFDPSDGERLAREYLELSDKKKTLDAELKAIRADIVKFCETMDLTRLETDGGHVKVTITESDEFPTVSRDRDAFLAISQLVRDAGIETCFKLDVNALFKELYAKEKLPPELKEKLDKFLVKRRGERVTTSYKISGNE